jgi:hypothetical protein
MFCPNDACAHSLPGIPAIVTMPACCRDWPFRAVPQINRRASPEPCIARAVRWRKGDLPMDGIVYLVGLVVIVMFILSFLGLR